ncbi:hypothetical protein ACRALDRAFT_205326 [Sodiomyces alcalophilus JCM 7366]|uniref:uncharacterized protein n=1 Tax=Sodiomyces alcalophilus JCM 7366 TaxID=591952 RepID=UPI0039B669DA
MSRLPYSFCLATVHFAQLQRARDEALLQTKYTADSPKAFHRVGYPKPSKPSQLHLIKSFGCSKLSVMYTLVPPGPGVPKETRQLGTGADKEAVYISHTTKDVTSIATDSGARMCGQTQAVGPNVCRPIGVYGRSVSAV